MKRMSSIAVAMGYAAIAGHELSRASTLYLMIHESASETGSLSTMIYRARSAFDCSIQLVTMALMGCAQCIIWSGAMATGPSTSRILDPVSAPLALLMPFRIAQALKVNEGIFLLHEPFIISVALLLSIVAAISRLFQSPGYKWHRNAVDVVSLIQGLFGFASLSLGAYLWFESNPNFSPFLLISSFAFIIVLSFEDEGYALQIARLFLYLALSANSTQAMVLSRAPKHRLT